MIREFLAGAAIVLGIGTIPGVWLGATFADEITAAWRWLLARRMPALRQHSGRHVAPAAPPRQPHQRAGRRRHADTRQAATGSFAAIPDQPTDEETREMYRTPAYGQRPVAEVRETERLAGVVQP